MTEQSDHFHQWKPGAWGPNSYVGGQRTSGRYAACECGAKCFVGVGTDGSPRAVLYTSTGTSMMLPVEVVS